MSAPLHVDIPLLGNPLYSNLVPAIGTFIGGAFLADFAGSIAGASMALPVGAALGAFAGEIATSITNRYMGATFNARGPLIRSAMLAVYAALASFVTMTILGLVGVGSAGVYQYLTALVAAVVVYYFA